MSAPELTFRYSPALSPLIEEHIDSGDGDLSQIGMTRGRFEEKKHLAFCQGVMVFAAGTLAFLIRFFLYLGIQHKVHEHEQVVVRFNTTVLINRPLNAEDIKALQKALRPAKEPTFEEIQQHPDWKHFETQVAGLVVRSSSRVAAAINSYVRDKPDVQKQLIDMKITKASGGGLEDESAGGLLIQPIGPGDIGELKFVELVFLQTLLGQLAESMSHDFDILFAHIDFERHASHEEFLQNRLAAKQIGRIANVLKVAVFETPAGFDRWFDMKSPSFENRLEVEVLVGPKTRVDDQNISSPVPPLSLKKEDKDVSVIQLNKRAMNCLHDMAFYFPSYIQADEPIEDNKHTFAFQRMLQARHGFYHDSDECCIMTSPDGGQVFIDVNQAMFDQYITAIRNPELFYADMAISSISFMKSGHHATAANLPQTASKIYSALGHTLDMDSVKSRIRCGVYNGAHVGSTRMQMAYWFFRQSTNPLSSAISYRLRSDPPNFMAVCNLERFADSLNAVGFFRHLASTLPIDYQTFKDAMKRIHEVKIFAAPYSAYLYGKTLPMPDLDLDIARILAPYASALNTILPHSTLLLSASLAKLSSQSSVNSLGAALQVEAFVSAFRQYGRRFIERSFAQSAGGTVPRIDL